MSTDVYYFHHHRRCWPTFIQYLPKTYLVQRMEAYPPNDGSMLGQRRSPLLVHCQSIVYNADPALIYHRVCCVLCANTCHSTNTVSMLTHSLRHWPVIETALGDCTVFPDSYIMLVTFKISAPETPDNTIHWLNADVMIGHRLRRWANIIPTKTL